MSRWLTVCLTPLAAASLVGALSLTDGKTRLSAAEIGNSGVVTKPIKANTTKARRDLEAAAKRGKLDAQIKLARMHALGVGVEHNDAKAFELYLKIITNHVNVRPQDAQARDLAQAFVALGNYYRTGIPGSNIKADPHQAVSVLRYAASYFGNVEAQSNLAQMYLDGEGIERNARLALNWLVNAANKRHAKSQAILGDLLWRGADGVPRQPKKGLALLALAQQNANGKIRGMRSPRQYSAICFGAVRMVSPASRKRDWRCWRSPNKTPMARKKPAGSKTCMRAQLPDRS